MGARKLQDIPSDPVSTGQAVTPLFTGSDPVIKGRGDGATVTREGRFMFGSVKKTVQLDGKALEVIWSKRADKVLVARQVPLIVDMRLEYRCMPTKVVSFTDCAPDHALVAQVTDKLAVAWSETMQGHCSPLGRAAGSLKDPVSHAGRKLPRRLTIDFANGEWRGEYGF